MEKQISAGKLTDFDASFRASCSNQIAMNAVTNNGVKSAARRWESQPAELHQFSIKLKNTAVTNQKASGRCWMFAAMNCLRYRMIQNLNLEDFELSQSYTFFYDKLERANYFFETIISTVELEQTDRNIAFLLADPVNDGGQWDMISSIIQKYGLVPKTAMPESKSSSGSREMNSILAEKLREGACILRNAYRAGKTEDELHAMKDEMVKTVYRILCVCLGTPPKTVDFEVRTKDGKFIRDCGLTPQEFYAKYIGVDLTQYISVINAPTDDKPYYNSYTVKYLGNVLGGTPVKYVNLPIEELKKAAIAQMKDGSPVWFGCDVGQHSERAIGAMDLKAYDYDSLFDTTFTMTKAQRLDYGHSAMTHAMVFQGVDLDEEGNPIRWCVENSWGTDTGTKGMFLMTDDWFNEYMYQVVVNRKYLSEEALAAYDTEPTVLAPWDPMGALAD